MTFRRRFVTRFARAAALAAAAACGNPQLDGQIAGQVDQEITNSPVLGGAEIDVAAHDGVVTLSGAVSSDEQARSAERLAWSVEGVEGVESRLEVTLPEDRSEPPPVGAAPPPEEETR